MTIVEPHMYNVDDAVARVDSYVVSVTGGGRHVGERRMVRIEEVGRSVATASLLDAPPSDEGEGLAEQTASRGREAEKADGDATALESSASSGRRRGRRGGRRRSRAASGEKNDG